VCGDLGERVRQDVVREDDLGPGGAQTIKRLEECGAGLGLERDNGILAVFSKLLGTRGRRLETGFPPP
jgi:hypothetical protein